MSRGRGRGQGGGRGKPYEGLGLGPGDPAPPPILQPPPLYPPLDPKQLKLVESQVEDCLVSIKQELRDHAAKSPFYLIQGRAKAVSIARYSDKYRRNGKDSDGMGWRVDWRYLPTELKVGKKRPKRAKRSVKKTSSLLPGGGVRRGVASSDGKDADSDDGNPPKPKKPRRKVTFSERDEDSGLVKKLESLEQAERLSAESEQSAEEDNAEELYDEDEEEEGTDYNLTYFDNGEDMDGGGEDNALEEGPVY